MVSQSGKQFAPRVIEAFQKRFEECIPITCMSIVLVEFVFGILGILKAGFYLSCLFLLASLVFSVVWAVKQKKLRDFVTLLFTPALAIFVAVYFLLSYANEGVLASTWDEFSHWMDVVKVTTTIDDFATNPNSYSAFKAYPPAMNMFQYFVQKIFLIFNENANFNEWRAFFAYQIFALSFFFPFLKRFSFTCI